MNIFIICNSYKLKMNFQLKLYQFSVKGSQLVFVIILKKARFFYSTWQNLMQFSFT